MARRSHSDTQTARVAKWLEELAHETRRLDITLSEAMLKNEEIVDLLEEGLQAARSLSDEKRSYIAKLVANGLSAEGIETAKSKHPCGIGPERCRGDLALLFQRVPSAMGRNIGNSEKCTRSWITLFPDTTPSDVHDKYALKRSYKEHLAQLGLVYPIYETDHQTDMPKFDKFTGATEVIYYSLSGLATTLEGDRPRRG